jgi:hypothetical protein
MYSYIDVGVAHAELLLFIYLRKKTLRGMKNLLLPVHLL